MTSEIVYAIYHPDSGLYFTGKTLSELGADTKLYKTKRDGMKAIEGYAEYISTGLTVKYSSIVNTLTWDYLEKEKGADRWHINVGNAEYNSVFEMMRQLKVVPVNLEHNQNVY